MRKNGEDILVHYILMEKVEGVMLFDFFLSDLEINNYSPMQDRYIRNIFIKVCSALHKLHSAGIAHRDIKPENIMITNELKIKIIDLGHGKHLIGTDGTSLMTTYVGTSIYIAPEIRAQKPYEGLKIDIFSMGVMFLALRTM